MKVLMVCLGNICRSPMADGLLRKKVEDNNLAISVDSAGTGGWHAGEAPDSRMIKTAANNGVSIEDLRARQFKIIDFDNFDLIYVMDKSNYKNVLQLARNENDKKKVDLLLNISNDYTNKEVPDPYYGTEKDFQDVFDLLDGATDILLQKLIEK